MNDTQIIREALPVGASAALAALDRIEAAETARATHAKELETANTCAGCGRGLGYAWVIGGAGPLCGQCAVKAEEMAA